MNGRSLLVLPLLCSCLLVGCVHRAGGSSGSMCVATGRDGNLISCEAEADARVGERCVCSDTHGLYVGWVQ